jgi:hypothetical protein
MGLSLRRATATGNAAKSGKRPTATPTPTPGSCGNGSKAARAPGTCSTTSTTSRHQRAPFWRPLLRRALIVLVIYAVMTAIALAVVSLAPSKPFLP